jgi:hypothetical protein
MWIKIRIVKEVDHTEEDSVGRHAIDKKFKHTQLNDEIFAGHSMKLKKVPGVLGDFFSESSNATACDENGNYVWHRDPSYFKYIMDFIRDGDVSWPSDPHELEMLLDECDYFEIGPMVLQLIEQARAPTPPPPPSRPPFFLLIPAWFCSSSPAAAPAAPCGG